MATERLRTIKPSGQGGDYTSIVGWEAGEQANLVSLDEYRVGEIDGDWSSASDTTADHIDGWTTDATRYIELRTAAAARHVGKWDASKHRWSVGNSYRRIYEDFVRLIGVQIELTTTAGYTGLTAYGTQADGALLLIDRCIFKGTGVSGAGAGGIGTGARTSGAASLVIRNCLFQDFQNGATVMTAVSLGSAYWDIWIDNCTVVDCYRGIDSGSQSTTDVIARNCLCQGIVDDGFRGGRFVTGTANNCSNISSDAPGSNPVTGTVTFVDSANDDFHLAASDTVAKDAGADLSGVSDYAFSIDIDGQARSGSWDIGADEYTSGGSALTTSLSDPLSLGESLGRSMSMGRAMADTVSLGDSMDRSAAFIRALADAAALDDSLGRSTGFARALSDAIALADANTAAIVIARALADALSLGDSLSRQLALSRVLTEALVLAEQIGGAQAIARALSDTLTVGEQLTGSLSGALVRALADAIALGDSTTASAQLVRALADAIALSDSTTTAAVFVRLVTDGLSITDALTASAILVRALGDQVVLADQLFAFLGGLDVSALRGVIESLRLRATIADQRLRGTIVDA